MMHDVAWGQEHSEKGVKSASNNEDPKRLTVETVDNHIYFYAYVDSDRILALMKSIREKDTALRTEHISRGLPDDFPLTPIWLHIQTGGGGLLAGFAAADQLATIKTPVHSIVEGMCSSTGTLISCACKKRYITPGSFMMIHQLSSFMWGKYDEFQDTMVFLDSAMERLTNFYVENTKMGADIVKELLGRESYFNAEQCVELGLADEIRSV